VTRVVDGDTVWLRTPERSRIKARLHGIDAPESCQVGGHQATDWLRQRLDQRVVRVTWMGRDSYGRDLVRLALDGRDLGADMVAQGWAWSYAWRGQRSGYEGLQAEAQRARRGVFGQGQAQRPRDFRRQHGPCH
jgi:endonuclease YncB( thermonuclease family)